MNRHYPTTEIKAILQRFPNGLKRTHLHHGYDPEMNYGEKRHVYKWTRASKVALLDNFENDDSLGGKFEFVVCFKFIFARQAINQYE